MAVVSPIQANMGGVFLPLPGRPDVVLLHLLDSRFSHTGTWPGSCRDRCRWLDTLPLCRHFQFRQRLCRAQAAAGGMECEPDSQVADGLFGVPESDRNLCGIRAVAALDDGIDLCGD